MRKTFRRAALSTICMLVVAVMSLTGVTYAWFTQATYSKVDGMQVKVEAATGGVFVAAANNTTMPADSAFVQNLDLALSAGESAGVKPVSTVGGKDGFNFFKGELVSQTNVTTTADTTTENIIKHYLFLRNTTSEAMTVDLGHQDGFVSSIALTNTESTKTTADAARVGLRYVATTPNTGASGTSDGSVMGNTGYGIFANNVETYKGVNGPATNMSIANGSALADVTTTAADEFEILVPANTTVTVELLVWLEGQDNDCINDNADETFKVTLYFDKVTE